MKVLVVDDDTLMHQVITAFLTRYGEEHEVDIVIKAMHDPVQALFEMTANGSAYDLILLDVRLPKLSGDEIYTGISKGHPELLKRILFITGFPKDLKQKLPEMELRVLEKPFRYPPFETFVSEIIA
ncbi:response regulator [Pseudomonadota bacterium]